MGRPFEVRVGAQPLERFRKLLTRAHLRDAIRVAHAMRERLAERVVWNINTTAVGGGVAEMLRSLLSYTRGAGIDTRWMVIHGNEEFFRVTKRLHHALHGAPGHPLRLGDAERRIYEETLRENALELAALIQPGDFVILHDPQTAGLAPLLRRSGAHLLWRCHIGNDVPSEESDAGWHFLRPYLDEISLYVFSRNAYIPEICDHGKSVVIRPSIDPFSPKNQELSEQRAHAILVHTGLLEGPPPARARPVFQRLDGTPARVERQADVVRCGRAPAWDTPLVVQVSRWDPLKDMKGVLEGFARLTNGRKHRRAELVLAGPNVRAVADDPEGPGVFEDVLAAWRALPHALRSRVHLASLPTADIPENAAIVNALQRHAAVVVQKSLREGFGLTVTEAMWKARPVLASAVGGIQDQIEDGVSGILLKDPRDLDEFAQALDRLLADPERSGRLGAAARERVREHALGLDQLLQYAKVIERLDAES